MGGGLPAAAFGGRAEVMSRLAPAGPVYQAGTLSGNPLAVAAGLATLRACTDEVYLRVDAAAATVARLVARGADQGGRAAPGADRRQPVLGLLHRGRGARLRRRAAAAGLALPGRSSTRCWPAASTCRRRAYEAWFVSAAHDDAVLDRIADALPEAARAAAAAHPRTVRRDDRRRCTCSGTARCTTRTTSCTAGCPAATSPPLGRADGRAGGEGAARPGRHPPGVLPAGAGAGDRGAARGRRSACRCTSTTGCWRRRTPSRASRSAPATGPGAHPRRWPLLRNPFRPSWGEPYRAHRRADARRGVGGPGRGRGTRGGLRQPPAADLDAAPAGGAQAALARPDPPAVRAGVADQHHASTGDGCCG